MRWLSRRLTIVIAEGRREGSAVIETDVFPADATSVSPVLRAAEPSEHGVLVKNRKEVRVFNRMQQMDLVGSGQPGERNRAGKRLFTAQFQIRKSLAIGDLLVGGEGLQGTVNEVHRARFSGARPIVRRNDPGRNRVNVPR